MLTIINFRPFVTVQKLIPGRETPNPPDTFPVRRLKSSDLFLALCILYLPHPPGDVRAPTTVHPLFSQKIVKVLRFYQRTPTCPMIDAQKLSAERKTLSGRALCPAPHKYSIIYFIPLFLLFFYIAKEYSKNNAKCHLHFLKKIYHSSFLQ